MYALLKTIYKLTFKHFPYFVLSDYDKITEFTMYPKRLFPILFRIFLKLSYTSPDMNVATTALDTFLWYSWSIQYFASVLVLDY